MNENDSTVTLMYNYSWNKILGKKLHFVTYDKHKKAKQSIWNYLLPGYK